MISTKPTLPQYVILQGHSKLRQKVDAEAFGSMCAAPSPVHDVFATASQREPAQGKCETVTLALPFSTVALRNLVRGAAGRPPELTSVADAHECLSIADFINSPVLFAACTAQISQRLDQPMCEMMLTWSGALDNWALMDTATTWLLECNFRWDQWERRRPEVQQQAADAVQAAVTRKGMKVSELIPSLAYFVYRHASPEALPLEQRISWLDAIEPWRLPEGAIREYMRWHAYLPTRPLHLWGWRFCTPLEMAIYNGGTPAASLMLTAGACPHLPGWNRTPLLEVALRNGNHRIVAQLLKSGAKDLPVKDLHEALLRSVATISQDGFATARALSLLHRDDALQPKVLRRLVQQKLPPEVVEPLQTALQCQLTGISELLAGHLNRFTQLCKARADRYVLIRQQAKLNLETLATGREP